MKLATFNVNSVRARLPNLIEWLGEAKPDAVLLQEIKCEEKDFPAADLKAAGYESFVTGQKSYNGVTVLSRSPVKEILSALPGGDDPQARYQEVELEGLRLINIYAPNGNPLGTEKFSYKLAWLERLAARLEVLLREGVPFAIGGDFNIIPEVRDCLDPATWAGDALFQPESRAMHRRFIYLGLTDAFRALHPTETGFTFWDYQAGAWAKNNGIRIDHFLLAPALADRLRRCEVDRAPRGKEKASDHTPLVLTLA